MNISELHPTEYGPFYKNYINVLGNVDLKAELNTRKKAFVAIVSAVPESRYLFSYAEGKWTIKQLILHIIDTERVFQSRAFSFARNPGIALKGFDQDLYVENSNALQRSKDDLIAEYTAVRNSSICLFENFTDEMLLRSGTIEGSTMSVRAAGFIISGHQKHHEAILQQRYLNSSFFNEP